MKDKKNELREDKREEVGFHKKKTGTIPSTENVKTMKKRENKLRYLSSSVCTIISNKWDD